MVISRYIIASIGRVNLVVRTRHHRTVASSIRFRQQITGPLGTPAFDSFQGVRLRLCLHVREGREGNTVKKAGKERICQAFFPLFTYLDIQTAVPAFIIIRFMASRDC